MKTRLCGLKTHCAEWVADSYHQPPIARENVGHLRLDLKCCDVHAHAIARWHRSFEMNRDQPCRGQECSGVDDVSKMMWRTDPPTTNRTVFRV